MKILAVDTSSFAASAAIVEDGIVLGESVIRNKRKHSQNIMPMIGRMFTELEMNIRDIDLFAVTTGPGSFTGLRIGISTMRAFAQAMGKPIIGINTLEAIAYNFVCSEHIVVPMLDARRDEVFTAAYRFDGETPVALIEPCVMTIDGISSEFTDKTVIYAGDGMIAHRNEITRPGAIFSPPNLSETRAASVAALAFLRAGNGEGVGYNDIQPVYLRKSQAEREYENKHKESIQ